MKKSWNNLSCFGLLMLLAGGSICIIFANSYINVMNDPSSYYEDGGVQVLSVIAITGVVAIIGLFLVMTGTANAKRWNKVVSVVKSQNQISLKETSVKSGVPVPKVTEIIYDAIGSGDLSGTIQGETFTKSTPSSAVAISGAAKVLVICPYCGAKTEQGLSNCQKCGASL